MAKFRQVDDLYGRFLDHVDLDEVPIATVDKDGNTVVMTRAEYETMLAEQEEEKMNAANNPTER